MKTDKPLNVILIGIDTLRYDHLGFSGYQKNTSPNIDKLAEESWVFRNCFAQAPQTGPSFASLLTSRYPTFHGIINIWGEHRGWTLAENVPTLPEILKRNGYTTAAFTGGGTLDTKVGLSKGFDAYRTVNGHGDISAHPAVRWMEQNKEKPFFLFFHTFATHTPYITPTTHVDMVDPNYRGRFPANIGETLKNDSDGPTFKQIMDKVKHVPEEIERLKKMYDACITYMDSFIGQFLEKLRTLGLEDNTIIVFTTDHGEEFMEHGKISHYNIYDEILHIPLLIKIPGMRVRKDVDQIVRSIDIMPTILDLVSIQTEETLQGTSLLSTINDVDLNLVSLAEYKYAQFSLRNKYYKYIFRAKKEELYNIIADPMEKENLSKYSTSLVEKFYNEFQRELAAKKLVRPAFTRFFLHARREQ